VRNTIGSCPLTRWCAFLPYAPLQVYAFGMLLWEMMTRQRPYAGIPVGGVALAVRAREGDGEGRAIV
jgi:hypothetical protein